MSNTTSPKVIITGAGPAGAVLAFLLSRAGLYGWTRLVNAEYEPADKIHLMELLWRVVLADGVVDDHEHALMRRLAGLIHVPDPDSARARARAREALPRS